LIGGNIDTSTRIAAEAKKKEIPVLIADGARGAPGVVCNVTSSNTALGEQVTEWIAEQINYKGNIIVFPWPTAQATHDRYIGMTNVLKRYPDIKILEEHVPPIPGLVEGSMRIMNDLLVKYPSGEIDAVWTFADECAMGVAAAIDSAGRSNEIVVTGVDGLEQALDLIRKGSSFQATIVQNAHEIGRVLAEMAIRAKIGKRAVPDPIYIPTELVTKDNISK